MRGRDRGPSAGAFPGEESRRPGFFQAMGDKALVLAGGGDQLTDGYGRMEDRQPGLLGLEHGADQDILQTILPDLLSFRMFTQQGDDDADAYLGGLFEKPFEAGRILQRGDGERNLVLRGRIGVGRPDLYPAFLFMVVQRTRAVSRAPFPSVSCSMAPGRIRRTWTICRELSSSRVIPGLPGS